MWWKIKKWGKKGKIEKRKENREKIFLLQGSLKISHSTL